MDMRVVPLPASTAMLWVCILDLDHLKNSAKLVQFTENILSIIRRWMSSMWGEFIAKAATPKPQLPATKLVTPCAVKGVFRLS